MKVNPPPLRAAALPVLDVSQRSARKSLHDILDASQWIELMTLYREMAADSAKDAEEESVAANAAEGQTVLVRRA